MNSTILIIGACGQIGTELTTALTTIYGEANVIAADRHAEAPDPSKFPNYVQLDILDNERLTAIIQKYQVGEVYLLAAMLSATGEQNPDLAWKLNVNGLLSVLKAALTFPIKKIFWPSSIAVFGPASPKHRCPQDGAGDPATVYGISKRAGEDWCRYYYIRHGLDVRSIRFPGLISYSALPGGGTTDYAVEIFHQALKQNTYNCFLAEDRCLPMMYMPDAIRAIIELMAAPKDKISVRTAYNVGGMSFSPCDLAAAIRRLMPDFRIMYAPDYRDAIAGNWPASVDDDAARRDWHWKPEYDLDAMTIDMLKQLIRSNDGRQPKISTVVNGYPDFPVENGMFSNS